MRDGVPIRRWAVEFEVKQTQEALLAEKLGRAGQYLLGNPGSG